MDSIAVLLVDDNLTFLNIATRFLREYADVLVVGTACKGEEALARASALRPQIILLDLAMPGMAGLDVIPHLRAALPEAGIVVLTMLDRVSYRPVALAAGANDFVSKAAMITDLLPAIRRTSQAISLPRDGRVPALAAEASS